MKRRKPKQIKALLGVGSAIINDNFENPASATKTVDKAPDYGAFLVSDQLLLGQNPDNVEPVGESMGFSPTKKMHLLDNLSSTALIGFTLPKLHTGKSWYVDFFAYDPVSDTMKRKKYMLDHEKKRSDRQILATMLIVNITQRLIAGWNPWVNDDGKQGI